MIRAGVGKMNEADALDIMQAAIWTILIASGPAVLTAMVVGVGIALLQALTQVQEMTLTFVPKIVAIMLVIGMSAPFIGAQINLFATLVFSRVQSGF
jgi:flagellar biosynthetic protein FliQ